MSTLLSYLRWFKSVFRRVNYDLQNDLARQSWWRQGVSIDPSAIIRLGVQSRLEIGAGAMIGAHTILDLQNDPLLDPVVPSVLRIGKRTAINEFNNIRAANGEIVIGDNCLVSQFVSIIAANHSIERDIPIRDQPADLNRNTINIGDDVWIGANAVILPGVSIGSGSIVAAGAVVTKNVGENVVVAGVPARVLRPR